MSEKRFERWNDCSCKVKDNQKDIVLNWKDVVHKLNEQQATIQSCEKRFYITETGLGLDTESDEMYSFGDEEDFCRLFDKLNEQQSIITSLKDENLYKNFKLKSVDDLKKLKDIFETCMILIDGAVVNEDLELGYESAFQFERRIKKFNSD